MANIDIDELLRRQMRLAQLENNGIRSYIAPSLRQALKDIRAILADVEEITSRRQLQAIERAISEAIQAEQGWALLTEELSTMAERENEFMATVVASGTTAATSEQVQRLANNTMMILKSGEATRTGLWDDFVKQNLASQEDLVKGVVRSGYANGLTGRQMRGDIQRLFDGMIARHAEAIARTGYNHYSTVGRRAFADANKDIVAREVPIVTFDSRVSSVCLSVGAKYGQRGWKAGESPIGLPPYHMNCLFDDSFITSGYGISSVSKRRFEGVKVTITTASGNKLSVTPNHPILTGRGWVPAELINLSDKLALQSGAKRVANVNGDDYNIESRVDKIFDSFGRDFEVVSAEVPTSAPDFHSDGINNEVAVVNSKRLLLGKAVSNISKDFGKLFLKLGNSGEVFLSCDGCSFFFFGRLLSPSNSFVRSLSEVVDLLGGTSSHSGELLFRSVSDFNSHFFKESSHSTAGHSKISGDSLISDTALVQFLDVSELGISRLDLSGFSLVNTKPSNGLINCTSADTELSGNGWASKPIIPEFSDVVDVDFTHVKNSYVYNIETVDNCYAANGIITHNCRTSIAFLADGQSLTGTRATQFGQVDAKTTINQFVKDQSNEWQDKLLGPERAQLFRDGKLELSKLTDAQLRPLTLDEIIDD